MLALEGKQAKHESENQVLEQPVTSRTFTRKGKIETTKVRKTHDTERKEGENEVTSLGVHSVKDPKADLLQGGRDVRKFSREE